MRPRRGGSFKALFSTGEASVFLLAAHLALMVVPFRHITRIVGVQAGETPKEDSPEAAEKAREVQHFVRLASRKLPWKPSCLVRCLAALGMLRRRGLESTLYLGVTPEDGGRIGAHAWLRCGSVVVIGEKRMDDFSTLTSFSKPG